MRKIETLLLTLTLSAPLAFAGNGKVFTNSDLKGGPSSRKTTATGSVTTPEMDAPAPAITLDVVPEHRDDTSSARADELKRRYKELRRRKNEIEEEELPTAREEAERSKPAIFVGANPYGVPNPYGYPGVPVVVGSGEDPVKERVRKLETELRGVDDEIADIESEAHDLGLGRPALMQR
ncbi:MAG: hypothetical protein U0166_23045 [Acidobacteriota bacterium]